MRTFGNEQAVMTRLTKRKQFDCGASATSVTILTLLAAMLGGCASMIGLDETPRVSLVSIEPTHVRLLEQRFRVTLRVQNPNARDITIRGLDYEIVLNDRTFAQGVSGKPVTVPAWGESTAEVEVVSTLQRFIEQLEELGSRGKPGIDYAISGSISIDGIPLPVPFHYEDTIGIPAFDDDGRKDGREQRRKPKAIAI
ncbi:MAG: hypothetical protein GTO67_09670 [Gammaproteobacteria bacterium]|nr:hypothetical protein [Gammaproteobacteria bacterium]NIM74019.1 hypothetical protein [Gammaproteobacteria bacterium]NIN38901.1 hypothetical protein [Gammaproteobacteria bacterium]NIO25794.1 hypothetical protein [Gammaproteobacteria bacterium]NIO66425.1 hypothetical protein [Gammaproteobacteria bacterium]